jgi:DNA polymerase (family 10)
MGDLLEVRGENPFRTRAYRNAAQALLGLSGDLAELIADGSLAAVPGIGEAMHAKIVEFVTTGRIATFERLKAETPPGLVALLRLPGLGSKKVLALHELLQIESLADLRAAAEAGRIAPLKGFGAKTEERIKKGLEFLDGNADRMLLSTALRRADALLAWLRDLPGIGRAEIAGSLRRRTETVDQIDLVCSAAEDRSIPSAFAARPDVAEVVSRGANQVSVRSVEGIRYDLRVADENQFGCLLCLLTGSSGHVAALRDRAVTLGFQLSEAGLVGPAGPIACPTEDDLFAALRLAPIPPELREGRGEIEAAANGALPELLTRADLTGTFHCHTDWSDGGATLEEMAEAARAAGLTYLGIADHSRSAAYARGLSIERVRDQWAAIDAINERCAGSFRIFKGIECDILADGSLDYPDEILAGFDYVVASVHSNFGLPRTTMTERIVRAVEHSLVTMLGHPSGRLLLARAGYAVDLEAVIAAAARSGTMIEINANPHRLDLDADHAAAAKALGVAIVINPDAHAPDGFGDLAYGVDQARRAGLGPADVFNARDPRDVAAALAERRRRALA